MTALSERLLARSYATTPHPYKLFERAVKARLTRKAVLLVIVLTATMWDYCTWVARLATNRFPACIVSKVEGRAEEDTFTTEYRTNTRGDVEQLALRSGLKIESFEYLNQYPSYLMFNGVLFFIGTCFEKLISRFHALQLLRGWILVTLRRP